MARKNPKTFVKIGRKEKNTVAELHFKSAQVNPHFAF